MLSHGLKNSGITLSPMVLDQCESLCGPTVRYGIERRGSHPEVIARTQHEHGHHGIVNDLHNENENCGALAEK
jgi:hypothetical protein